MLKCFADRNSMISQSESKCWLDKARINAISNKKAVESVTRAAFLLKLWKRQCENRF